MALSAFIDQAQSPSDERLGEVLGKSHRAWTRLLEAISQELAPVSLEWGFASATTGWGLRIRVKKRVIVYVTPNRGYFTVSFALGEKAVKAAHELGLPQSVLEVIEAAPRYAEGRGVRFVVRHLNQVPALVMLARVKHDN